VRLTVVFVTGRTDPKLGWVVEDLCEQMREGDSIDLVVIDAMDRKLSKLVDLKATKTAGKLRRVTVSPPKPTIWQGPSRITSVDWWAASNARNTAIALCRTDYVAFVDDRCRLGPQWLSRVRIAERERDSVIAGSYDKQEGRRITQSDHRRALYPDGKRDCGGGWLYGCTFAMPFAWCLEANGFEEGCDGLSGEDCIFGFNVANNGHRIDFDPLLYVMQDRPSGQVNKYMRANKGTPPEDKWRAAVARFGKRKRTEFTPDLTKLRAELAKGKPFPAIDPKADYRDWFDGTSIRDLKDGLICDTASFTAGF